ncbi:MAG: hypothetical protein ACAI44_37085 [Candidatus Sericytochromatia bacterium]
MTSTRSLMMSLCSGLALLAGCQAPAPVSPAARAPLADQTLPYSFRTRAFDGSSLWQVLREDSKGFLIRQSLPDLKLSRIPMPAVPPQHRSLAWGRNALWMLDYSDRLYQIDPADGKILASLDLADLPETRASEQIVWSGDQLWLLMRPYVSSNNKLEPSRFIRLDPASGKSLETRTIAGEVNTLPRPSLGFSDFVHQNLSADQEAFYVLRSDLYVAEANRLYRIDKQSLAVTQTPLSRVYTGVPTLFFRQGQPWAVELLDTTNCGEFCRGKLQKL